MKPNNCWGVTSCEIWPVDKQARHPIYVGKHFIEIRKTTNKDNKLEVTETCEKCRISRWEIK